MHRVELVDQRARPVVEDVGDPHSVGDAEGQIQVGEAVGPVDGERPHDGTGDDAIVLLREPEHPLAERIPLLNGEHGVRSWPGMTALRGLHP
jgi:hypothetical protein